MAVPPGAAGQHPTDPDHLTQLEAWMRSYRPMSCSTTRAGCSPICALAPRATAAWVPTPTPTAAPSSTTSSSPTSRLRRLGQVTRRGSPPRSRRACWGSMLRDVMKLNGHGPELPDLRPDETEVQTVWARLRGHEQAVGGRGPARRPPPGAGGRVMSDPLRAHLPGVVWRATCSPGRHGLFSCYEAFIHIVDSMSTSTASGRR